MRVGSALLLAAAVSLPAFAGTVAVDIRNARRSPVRDVVVYAVPVARQLPLVNREATMDQKNRTFIPHVLVVQTGTTVRFPNSDDIQHHVYSFSPIKPFQLPLYKGNASNPIVFDRPGVAEIGCNIHDRMSAYIVVVDTPHFAKSDASGSAVLRDLDPGTYALHVWYPEMRGEAEPARITMTGVHSRAEFSYVTGSGTITPGPPSRPIE
jgi:plastocyanin